MSALTTAGCECEMIGYRGINNFIPFESTNTKPKFPSAWSKAFQFFTRRREEVLARYHAVERRIDLWLDQAKVRRQLEGQERSSDEERSAGQYSASRPLEPDADDGRAWDRFEIQQKQESLTGLDGTKAAG